MQPPAKCEYVESVKFAKLAAPMLGLKILAHGHAGFWNGGAAGVSAERNQRIEARPRAIAFNGFSLNLARRFLNFLVHGQY
jgi:hypothetical protein